MIDDFAAVLGRDALLQLLDLAALELDHLAGVDIDHVVVVLAAIEFVHRMPALEVVFEHQPGGLELGQHAVHRGRPISSPCPVRLR